MRKNIWQSIESIVKSNSYVETCEIHVSICVLSSVNFLDVLPNVDEAKHQHIHGIIGIINLIAGPYLIVITSKLRVGEINGQIIYKVQTTEIIPYSRNMSHLNEHQVSQSWIIYVLKTFREHF